jgi:hypothetical protein
MDDTQSSRSFLIKAGKFLAAFAGVLTALTGLLALLNSIGYFGPSASPPSYSPVVAAPADTQPRPIQTPHTEVEPIVLLPEPTEDLVDRYRPSLKAAILLGDNAEIQAQRTLDPGSLYTIFTGEALKAELASIQNLTREGVYLVAELEDQDFQSFKVSADGRRAEVQLVETWSVIAYAVANQACGARFPSHQAPQTVFLERGTSGWLIYAIEQDSKPPDPLAC